MKIIDMHSHIEYITHNFQHDVVGTVCCTKNESEWQKLIDIINNDNRVYGAFGVHPWFLSDIKQDFENRLEQQLLSNPEYMVGEIGLDKYHPDMEKQIEVFINQLNIAIKLKRIVFLHCVGAWDKTLHILKQYKKSELPMIVVHGFNDSDVILKNFLEEFVEEKYYLTNSDYIEKDNKRVFKHKKRAVSTGCQYILQYCYLYWQYG